MFIICLLIIKIQGCYRRLVLMKVVKNKKKGKEYYIVDRKTTRDRSRSTILQVWHNLKEEEMQILALAKLYRVVSSI